MRGARDLFVRPSSRSSQGLVREGYVCTYVRTYVCYVRMYESRPGSRRRGERASVFASQARDHRLVVYK